MKNKAILIIIILTGISSSLVFGQVTKEEWFDYGKKDFETGYYLSALEYFDEAIALDSTYAIAYYYKGLTYKKGAREDVSQEAVSNFKKAIQLDTVQDFWEAYYYLATRAHFIDTSYYKLNDKAIFFQPNNSAIYTSRGYYYYWIKMDYKKAISDFEKAIQLNNKNVSALSALGTYYYINKKDLNKALEYFDKIIELNPNDTNSIFTRAQILCKLGKQKRLKKDLRKLTELTEYVYTNDNNCIFKLTKKN